MTHFFMTHSIGITLAITLAGLPVSGQSVQASDPQIVAKSYLTAFFHGDLKTASELTHPSTLATLRTGFLAELSNAKAASKEKDFFQGMGINPTGIVFENLSPSQLFILLTESNFKRNPAGFEAMKQAKVETLSVQSSEPSKAVVRVKISVQVGGNTSTQDSGLELQLVGSEWRVVGSAQ